MPRLNRRLKSRLRILWHGWGKPILTASIVALTFKSAVADWNDVPTGSMKPTILEGDRIFVNKLAYDLKVPFTTWHLATWADPQRGDVVVLFSPYDGTRLVKRVIGLPGDTIELRDNHLLINGTPIDYAPADQSAINAIPAPNRPGRQFATEKLGAHPHPVMITAARPAPRWYGPVVVPAGQYFLMGDNRDESFDSRFYGFVNRSNIVGRASAIALSLDPTAHYLPRWNRFFHSLP